MAKKEKSECAELGKALEACRRADARVQRQVALLKAIIRVFRETLPCGTEEEVARTCLNIAEDLTGSAYGFIGELNEEGLFDTKALSDAGWNACRIPGDEADTLLMHMPNRGINRIGLRDRKSWIINQPDSHPDTVEKPPGHPAITSFMGVPMRFMGGITGMIALANKESGYGPDDQQDVEALAVAVMEVINRRRAEMKIQELNEELSRHVRQVEIANKELEAFSYSVSHDLRAPLRHITGFVELLNKRKTEALDEKSRHYLQVISGAAVKMGVLIDDLLAFSRMSRTDLMKSRIDFNGLVRHVVDEMKEESAERDIEWEVGVFPAVDGDAALLRQVMINLVANALKFTRSRRPAKIGLGAVTDRPGETLFFVRDNGVGFDMKYADKLFGLFQRLHTQEEFEGTGVGLANVQRIISRHGGRAWAEGSPDGGAVFWFSLPKIEEG